MAHERTIGWWWAALVAGACSVALPWHVALATQPRARGTVVDLAAPAATARRVVAGGLVPGDTVTRPLTVANGAARTVRYTLTASARGRLARVLVATVRVGDRTTPARPCDDFDGAVVATFGTARPGRVAARDLAGGSQEVLCVRVAFPPSASNALQDAVATLELGVTTER